ncbi:hypothetical protein [Pseudoteredinibacter isoporae]|uniref:hypothetical protein n=1 Tax=Pseudoteredinibacter isoporae TaxID=570281 RepID=UPI00333FFAB1
MKFVKQLNASRRVSALIMLFYCLSLRVNAEASVEDVHNIAEICTSVQTVMKDYSLVGMGVKFGDPPNHLKETIRKVDQDFASLKKGQHLGPELDALVSQNEAIWKKIRSVLTQKPERELALQLHLDIETLDKECWKIAELIAKETHIEGEHYVIVASELGMEVQRLASLYMMKAWDVSNENYYEEVDNILVEFEAYYHELETDAYPKYISEDTKAKLDKVEKDFSVFKYMAASKSGRFVPSLGQRAARKLEKDINEIIKQVIYAIEGV